MIAGSFSKSFLSFRESFVLVFALCISLRERVTIIVHVGGRQMGSESKDAVHLAAMIFVR